MAHAYTPGLKVTPSTIVRRRRILPIPGDVTVAVGDTVTSDQVVARTELPGKVVPVNVMNALAVTAKEIPDYMLKKPGDKIAKGESIAETKPILPFLKFLTNKVVSPIDGVMDDISDVTGQVLLREPPVPLEVDAYIDGKIVEVTEKQGVVVETLATMIQGIFGVGGERRGEIEVAVDGPDAVLDAEKLGPEHEGKVVVCGATVSWGTIEAARKHGVIGLVAGGVQDSDVRKLLGYDIGVAITGTEPIGFTLIVTEGFGTIPMARKTFELLQEIRGRRASLSGATQIRAGVIRPEILVAAGEAEKEVGALESQGLEKGTMVRVIRQPYFGRIGKVATLPHELTQIETEAKVRILTVDFGGGEEAPVPRANVEIIEER
ncbi:MAG: hypothetical protein ACYTAF_11160 [Planctomycetota bacterium]|jgi:hypothetical protein